MRAGLASVLALVAVVAALSACSAKPGSGEGPGANEDERAATAAEASAGEESAPAPPQPAPAASEIAIAPPADFTRAESIFRQRCAFCHGEEGDGKGDAAPLLTPPPHSFVDQPFQLVTTDNGLPTEDDVYRTISEGMPGSAMPPWRMLLPAADRRELARYVMWLQKKRFIERQVAAAAERRARGKAAPTAEEILRKADATFAPGPVLELPPKPAFSPELAATGARLYEDNCRVCHGARGDGFVAQELKDSLGRIVRARSYNAGCYEGGYSDERLAQRILLGMPGTPMPGFAGALKERADVWGLVHRIRRFEQRPEGAAGRGRSLFHQKGCVTCHGVAGRGGVPNYNYVKWTVPALDVIATRMAIPDAAAARKIGEALTSGTLGALADAPPYPRFNVTLAQYDAIKKVIQNGSRAGKRNPRAGPTTLDMPAWRGELGERAIDDLLAYLVSLRRWDADEQGDDEG